jgi:hypothetical protein
MSTPIALDDCCDTFGEFIAFSGITVVYPSWWYEGGWKIVGADKEFKPCDAFYIYMASADTAPIIPSSKTTVSSKELLADWNLISLAALEQLGMGQNQMYVDEALTSIYLVTGDKTGYAQVVSPPADQPSWYYVRDVYPCTVKMQIGKGCWVFMRNAGTFGGFTSTPW